MNQLISSLYRGNDVATFSGIEVDPGESLADTAAQCGIIDVRPLSVDGPTRRVSSKIMKEVLFWMSRPGSPGPTCGSVGGTPSGLQFCCRF